MKTSTIILLVLSLVFTACQGLHEDVVPIDSTYGTFKITAIDNKNDDDPCDGFPPCDPFIDVYGAELQELANLTCKPVSICATCCMSLNLVYVTFYLEPDSSICGTQVLTYAQYGAELY
jgi:hypothetical protein